MGLPTIDLHNLKEHTEIHKIPKIYKEIYRLLDAAGQLSGRPYISLYILTFSNGCILLTIGSVYTKLGDFVNLGVLFQTMWINSR